MSGPPFQTRPQRPAPPPIGRFTANVLARLGQRTRFLDPALASRWEEIAGPEIAALSRPGRLVGGQTRTLEVHVRGGAAATLVSLEEAALIQRLAGVFGPGVISRIEIVQSGGAPSGGAGLPAGGLGRFRSG